MKQDGGADKLVHCFLSLKMAINPLHEAKITLNQTMWKALVQVKVFWRDKSTLIWRKKCIMWRYTLTQKDSRVSVHAELINVPMMQLCSSTEPVTWVGSHWCWVFIKKEKTECTWYFSKIYCLNVSANKASICSPAPTAKSRRSRSAVFRTPRAWTIHWPMLAVKP